MMDDLISIEGQESREIAHRIERFGVEHDRFRDGWGVPDNCIVVFRGGNITCYVPIASDASATAKGAGE